MLGPAAAAPPAGSAPATLRVRALPDGAGLRLQVVDADGRPSSAASVLAAWQAADGAPLRRAFSAALSAAPYAAAFWECPPLSAATLAQPFECVLLDAPALAAVPGAPDRLSFARAWAVDDGTPFATFANLGGDADLVAPRPDAHAEPADCRHLLAWLRSVPAARADALWSRLAGEVLARAAAGPVWLGTSGLGVRWLHVRLDRQPKYTSHAPYRDPRWLHGD